MVTPSLGLSGCNVAKVAESAFKCATATTERHVSPAASLQGVLFFLFLFFFSAACITLICSHFCQISETKVQNKIYFDKSFEFLFVCCVASLLRQIMVPRYSGGNSQTKNVNKFYVYMEKFYLGLTKNFDLTHFMKLSFTHKTHFGSSNTFYILQRASVTVLHYSTRDHMQEALHHWWREKTEAELQQLEPSQTDLCLLELSFSWLNG